MSEPLWTDIVSALAAVGALGATVWGIKVAINTLRQIAAQTDALVQQTGHLAAQTMTFEQQTKILDTQSQIYERQTQILDAQVKLELFNRRFEFLNTVMLHIKSVPSLETMFELDDNFAKDFLVDVKTNGLLFSVSVWNYVVEVETKTVELWELYEGDLTSSNSSEFFSAGEGLKNVYTLKSGTHEKFQELIEWFKKQPDIAFERFKPDLDLSKIINGPIVGISAATGKSVID
jgi:hypothetical protein